MSLVREGVFETNSSSTHSLVYIDRHDREDYVPKNSTIKVRFIDTDDEFSLSSLEDKVSYLVSHIVRNYKYNAATYEDLVDDVQNDYSFRRLDSYILEHFGKKIVFPTKYDGDIEEIVNINHQLITNDFDSLLEDIVDSDRDYLGEILSPDQVIELGRD